MASALAYMTSDSFARQERIETVVAAAARVQTKEEEIVITGLFTGFQCKAERGGQVFNDVSPIPPPVEMQKYEKTIKQKKVEGKFARKVPCLVTVDSINLVPGVVEELPDGSGWRVKVGDLWYSPKAKDWLLERCKPFYEKTDDSIPSIVGEMLAADATTFKKECWTEVKRGQTMVVGGQGEEVSVFRPHPVTGGAPEIVPYTQVRFPGVKLKGMVLATRDNSKIYIKVQADSQGTPSLLVKRDPDMPESERLKFVMDPNQHNLVPYDKWHTGEQRIGRDLYFWAKNFYMTPVNAGAGHAPGVTIYQLKSSSPADYVRTVDDVERPGRRTSLVINQWFQDDADTVGVPNDQSQYYAEILAGDNNGNIMRSFGMLDLQGYANISFAHWDLPLHVFGNVWKSGTDRKDANDPTRQVPLPENVNIRGFYSIIASRVVPDTAAYLVQERGMEISKERFEREFEDSIATTNKGDVKLPMQTPDKTPNPFNTEGINSVVVSVAGGCVNDSNDIERYFALNDDAAPLLQGKHRFYVLTSYRLQGGTDWDAEELRTGVRPEGTDEVAKYCGRNVSVEDNDAFFDQLYTGKHSGVDFPFYFHIFAVRKTIAFAQPYPQQQQEEEEKEEVDAEKPKRKKSAQKKTKRKKKRKVEEQ